MSEAAPNRDAQIAELANLTGLDAATAERYLNASNGDLGLAATLFFDESTEQQDATSEPDVDMADSDPTPDPTQNPPPPTSAGGGRTLGGAYVPPSQAPAAASSSSRPAAGRGQPTQRGVAGARTLRDLQSENQDFFAGGEKSGLAVQNPNQSNPRDQINSILKRARQNAPRPGGDEEPPTSSFFRGAGTTLGGDDAPSRTIPDPNANIPAPPPRAHRELHLWRDGFSVDDGDLFRYDDPANARTLEMINTGHAPLHILNVEHGQEVDVEVHAHKDEDYVKPKKKYVPFSGNGNRLGSPTPGASSSASTMPQPASGSTAASTSGGSAQPTVDVDSSTPTLTLQVRLGDGTRLSSRFNTTHTIGDVYDFVDRARPDSQGRQWALMTTFPSKELTDKSQVLGDIAEFKRGGVVVQKWK
ncbi:Cdc48-dependent protein degradation adaptor protein Shp1 [Pyrenophora tritici-repentis]|uniref:Cdc48-dependent protein degradation adaptor protein (Shp1) n=1 Tax=Pyrenophora tritici-repentis TaxID=45151 RepID=A0A2W1EDF1_9PLEO|nr:cdc48-dependent protein degradation adaptor protein [Pyrenophora tritici-repentis]KAF7568728.1 Cdc48-dependent protein degradation adaptor protein (Shp1) [Pyrenophora tritici-repentis]KAI0575302.1 cdc48-dependent protein degradation adaptor protein [Pyrenophora tritici-repentis]KAI0578578.1 cdc48-dependent protein degradation adaptor protein [Pyrenophora tritici-repentis]KAI0606526.1 cdc48-dependent protein degradation adaptor protein [Pyrenophora tritici-repentis]